MHTVIIDGQDLDYFRSVVSDGLYGNLGSITAVQLYVNDNGRIVLGTNGFTSAEFGRPNAPLAHPNDTDGFTTFPQQDHSAAENAAARAEAEGSGNPYANVPDDETL